jgi:hypothetical protein
MQHNLREWEKNTTFGCGEPQAVSDAFHQNSQSLVCADFLAVFMVQNLVDVLM